MKKYLIDEEKLTKKLGGKLEKLIQVSSEIFNEINSDLSKEMNDEDFKINVPENPDEWSDEDKEKVKKFEDKITELSFKCNYEVLTLDEIRSYLHFTDEDLLDIIFKLDEKEE